MPWPSFRRASFDPTRSNSSKIRPRSSAAIPSPVSATAISMAPARSRAETRMIPRFVYLAALSSRLPRMRLSFILSWRSCGRPSGMSRTIRTSAANLNSLVDCDSSMTGRSWKAVGSARSARASSRRSRAISSSSSPLIVRFFRFSLCRGGRSFPVAASTRLA